MDEEHKKAEINLPKRLTLGLKLNVNDSPLAKKIELLKSISATAKLDKVAADKKLAVSKLASKQLFKSAPTTTTGANGNDSKQIPVPPKNNAKEPQVKANSAPQSRSNNNANLGTAHKKNKDNKSVIEIKVAETGDVKVTESSELNSDVKVATHTAEQKQASKKDNSQQHSAKLKQKDTKNNNKTNDKKASTDKSKQDKQGLDKDEGAKNKNTLSSNEEEHKTKPAAELKPAGRMTITETRYQAILSDLRQRYPECFGEPVKALAIGIQFRLQETQLYSMSSILAFLSRYCSTAEYKANILQQTDNLNKVSRVNLDGSVSEIVKKDKQKLRDKNKDKTVKQKKEQLPKKLLMSKEEYKEMLKHLQQKYPDCFSSPVKPLAVGIHLQLREKEAGIYSNTKIRDFLKVYCLMTQYTSCLIPGEIRVNLDGSSTTLVEEQVPATNSKQ